MLYKLWNVFLLTLGIIHAKKNLGIWEYIPRFIVQFSQIIVQNSTILIKNSTILIENSTKRKSERKGEKKREKKRQRENGRERERIENSTLFIIFPEQFQYFCMNGKILYYKRLNYS